MNTDRRARQTTSPAAGARRPLGNRPARTPLLVIGYGNTLRGDDAAGPRVAEAVAALALPGVRVVTCHQLTPELAEPLAQSERVVFVDAAVDTPRRVRLRPLRPGAAGAAGSHFTDPRMLLALARQLYGRAPRAWWLTIPGMSFHFGESLSALARRGIALAVDRIRGLAVRPRGGRSRSVQRTRRRRSP